VPSGALTDRRNAMARFLIERNFAEQVELNKTAADEIKRINDDENIKWLF
jgi:hypothetical protein